MNFGGFARIAVLITSCGSLVAAAILQQKLEPNPVTGAPNQILVTVSDAHGKAVTDMRSEELLVFERQVPLRLGVLKEARAEPLTVGLMIDISGSRRGQLPGGEREGASRFLDEVVQMGATAFVGSFSTNVYLNARLTTDSTVLQDGLKFAMMKLPQGSSSLYTSIFAACQKVFAPRVGRKVLVITTDGEDNSSEKKDAGGSPKTLTAGEVMKTLLREDTILYVVLLGDSQGRLSPWGNRRARMNSIAEPTGGRVIVVDSVKEMTAAFEQIAAELNSQYRLEIFFDPPLQQGKSRIIRVETVRKGVKVISRREFNAPGH